MIVCENEERYNNYLVIVDANNSKVLGYYCLTNYSQGCKCLGYDITNSKREFIGTKEASDRYIMVDPVRKLDVREIKGENIYTRIVSSTKSDRDWDKNSVSLMANAQEVYDYYKDLEGFHRRGFDGKRNSMKMGINKDVTNNAEWINGENLLVCGIGDGAKMYQNDKQNGYFFRFKEGVAIASLDIVAHEYTHAHLQHLFYGNKTIYEEQKKIGSLDIDVRDGYGPETITLDGEVQGESYVYVHRYSSYGILGNSNASIKIYMIGADGIKRYTFCVPSSAKDYWTCFKYNSATDKVVVFNSAEKFKFF